jgi:exodeoxyribonuclease V alpha subunit
LEIQGRLNDIIYQNEVNGYTVATFETDEEELTIVGYLPFIHSGDTLKVIGKYVTHQDYGKQFKIDSFEKMMPQTLDALEQYLSNGTIKGIGPSTAKKIVSTFGEDTIHIFKYEPEKLANIKGITKEKAISIAQDFNENWEVWQIVGYLEQFGIGPQNAKKVYELLGANAITEIEENPYILVDIARGIDFKQIDKMAMKVGIRLENEKRVESGIKYSLNTIGYNGHTCVQKDKLVLFVKDLLQVDQDIIENSLINLNVKKEIVIEEQEEGLKLVYLYQFYMAELNIAQRLISLRNAENNKEIKKFKQELKKLEKNSSVELSDKQKEALEMVNNENVCIITGGPGTGKTTVIKSIIELYEAKGKKVVLCAPTGRAAKRMTEATGRDAKTLHRLLEIGKIEEEIKDVTKLDVAPIDADVIIVDEVSMVDVVLMNYMLKAIYKGTKLILVGDADQLPSVGPGSILKDMIESEKIATIHLDKIFRQAAKSKIIVNAHRVNEGKTFLTKEEAEKNESNQDFFYIRSNTQEDMVYQVLSLSTKRLSEFGNYNFFENIQVLSPTKKGALGTKELNKLLQQELNPATDFKKEKNSRGVIFREQDKVMQIRNNYDIYWEKKEPKYEYGSGVFNGEMGTIEKIDEIEKQLKIHFDDDKEAWYSFSDLDQIEHSYAITIHKAQRKRI